jgi:hypothetical protein
MGIKRSLPPDEDGKPQTWSRVTADAMHDEPELDEYGDADCPPDDQDKKPRVKPTVKPKPTDKKKKDLPQ